MKTTCDFRVSAFYQQQISTLFRSPTSSSLRIADRKSQHFHGFLNKLQAVENRPPTAARVVTGARKFDHITPVLRDLHWLPVRQRIKYKLAMTVYKCLRGLAPTYLADDCLVISAIAGKRHLRSARTGILSVPTITLGTRSFAVAGPVIWNGLPAALRTATLSPLTFARHLKAHLLGWSAARLRTIYDALYKSPHHHHHHHHHHFTDMDVCPVLNSN